ncbi:MAG TPA: hypothetical protein VF748_07785 [Candidatus Acidoferrum sp.]
MLLKILALEPMNGFAVSQRLKAGVRRRVAGERWIAVPGSAQIGTRGLDHGRVETSECGRRAKYYSLTRLGRRQLEREADNWGRLSSTISRVIKLEEA